MQLGSIAGHLPLFTWLMVDQQLESSQGIAVAVVMITRHRAQAQVVCSSMDLDVF